MQGQQWEGKDDDGEKGKERVLGRLRTLSVTGTQINLSASPHAELL